MDIVAVQQAVALAKAYGGRSYVPQGSAKKVQSLVAPIAMPSGPLVFAPSAVGVNPRSVAQDGGLYGHYNNHQMFRTYDANATRQLTADISSFDTDGILWCGRTHAGYVIITSNAAAVPNRSHVWFTPNSADPFTGAPKWSLVLSCATTTLTGFARPKILPDGRTVLVFGEYTIITPSVSLKRWASWDGGQNWTQIHATTVSNSGINSHCHTALIREDGRIWMSEGDGANAWFGYTDDHGSTAVPVANPSTAETYDLPFMQPTTMIDFGERICVSPDRGPFQPGMWDLDPDTGLITKNYDLPGTFQLGGSGATTPAAQYGHPMYAQHGREAYVSLPDTGSGTKKTYIVGTGDAGRSWHLLYTFDWGASGSLSTGIYGPDLNGNLYMTPFNADAPWGSALMTAPRPTWTWQTQGVS